MQGQLPHAVQTNASTHEMQGKVPHTVQTKTPACTPFSGGVREHQVHFSSEVNQGRFPPSVQTNTSTHAPFSGGVREQQIHFTPRSNQVRNRFILTFWSSLLKENSRIYELNHVRDLNLIVLILICKFTLEHYGIMNLVYCLWWNFSSLSLILSTNLYP